MLYPASVAPLGEPVPCAKVCRATMKEGLCSSATFRKSWQSAKATRSLMLPSGLPGQQRARFLPSSSEMRWCCAHDNRSCLTRKEACVLPTMESSTHREEGVDGRDGHPDDAPPQLGGIQAPQQRLHRGDALVLVAVLPRN